MAIEEEPPSLYKVAFAEGGQSAAVLTPNAHQAQQNQIVQQKNAPYLSSTSASSVKSQDQILMHPDPQQLSLSSLSPFPESIWSYMTFVTTLTVLWVFYLLLPRGCRKKYCSAYRKRYAKRTDGDMPASGYWLPANKVGSSFDTGSTAGGIPRAAAAGAASPTRTSTPYRDNNNNFKTPPSPEHPALTKIPPNQIIEETMTRLKGRGIRLLAHGVQCDPKRVWIKLQEATADEPYTVTWQTEFPRRVPNQSGDISIVLMRGSLHKIPLPNVLYIDVGKKTNALMRNETVKVPDGVCFSLLTQNGSLDLQANSKLERDALVSCFSMILDQVHENVDWRALYESSPAPSQVTSTNNLGTEVTYGGQQEV